MSILAIQGRTDRPTPSVSIESSGDIQPRIGMKRRLAYTDVIDDVASVVGEKYESEDEEDEEDKEEEEEEEEEGEGC